MLNQSQALQDEGGTVVMRVRYHWLRGTRDEGRRTHIDRLTVAPRKLTGRRSFITHVSNVNHWMMSHDNIWPALGTRHPAVVQVCNSVRACLLLLLKHPVALLVHPEQGLGQSTGCFKYKC